MSLEYRWCPECGRDVLTMRRHAWSECAECDAESLRHAPDYVRALCVPDPEDPR